MWMLGDFLEKPVGEMGGGGGGGGGGWGRWKVGNGSEMITGNRNWKRIKPSTHWVFLTSQRQGHAGGTYMAALINSTYLQWYNTPSYELSSPSH